MITSTDIARQVTTAVDACGLTADVDGIVAALVAEHDLTGERPTETVDGLDVNAFWGIVAAHAD